MRLGEAIERYTADCERRRLAKSTLAGKRAALGKLTGHLGAQRELAALTRLDLRGWARSLSGRPGAQRTVMRHVGAFFNHAVAEEWIERSPLRGVQPPRDTRTETQPLSRDELRAMLAEASGPELALLLLLRWSGLAIGDAVTLRPQDIRGGAVVTRRRKTGTLVCIPLPDVARAALDGLPAASGWWFWTGRSEAVTAAKTWRERLGRVARAAGIEGFHPHRLRDTFAVELLLDGVGMEDVARLLGHSSVTMTERFYAPWNRARLERLEDVVRQAHARDPLLAELAAADRSL